MLHLQRLTWSETDTPAEQAIDEMAEEKLQKMHTLDSLNLLLYIFLLILTVLTIWLFKRRRLRFIHETGLTMIFGLVIGAIIKYSSISKHSSAPVLVSPVNMTHLKAPPDQLTLKYRSARYNNTQIELRYTFTGSIVRDTDELTFEERATFSPEIFFNILLPPIIFNAGYSLKRRNFFRNIGSILTFAILGAGLSCVVVGFLMYGMTKLLQLKFELSQCLYFGALIASTDPVTVLAIFTDLKVDVDLFALVFGESALNDAVALVLSQTIESYQPSNPGFVGKFDTAAFFHSLGSFLAVFLGSLSSGAFVGCVTAIITKYTKISEYPTLETALFFLMSYSSFLMAEASGLTGIVAVLFCGICQAHYTFNNLSCESQNRTKQFFEMLTFLSENFIFTYIGVSLITSEAHNFDMGFISAAFFAIALGRALFVYPFSALINIGRRPKIPLNHQHMIFFAGLRGAIAFALAIRNTTTDSRRIIYTTTSVIVIVTVIVNGGLTMPMIQWLGIRHGQSDEDMTPGREFHPITKELSGDSLPESAPVRPHYNPWDKAFLPRKWYNFDSRFMKPLLTHSRPSLMETLPECCMPIARMLTTTQQMSERERLPNDSNFMEEELIENGPQLNANTSYHSTEPRQTPPLNIAVGANNNDATHYVSFNSFPKTFPVTVELSPPPFERRGTS